MMSDEKLKWTFDSIPELYDKARPLYPAELFDKLVELTRINATSTILEIGPGTGQATRQLAEYGSRIIAIELGPRLAALARKQLATFDNVEVVTGSFESWLSNVPAFDLVFAATAFHWIDPAIRFSKSHRLLVPQGYLAIVHTNHVSDMHGDAVYHASQPIFAKYYKGNQKESALPQPEEVKPAALDAALFENTGFWRFPLTVTYSAQEYAELFATFSSTLILTERERQNFAKDIEALITEKFGGSVTKHYVMSLTIGQAK